MGVVGSLPSPPPPPLVSIDNIKTLYEEPIPSSDECSYRIVTIDQTDCERNYSLNSTINEKTQSVSPQRSKRKSPTTLSYGPIDVKTRRSQPPTLATGRRSKFLELEGDAAVKRELRRKRNRDAAKKLKEKRVIIEQKLENDIQQLESKEQELAYRVKTLEIYKDQLETHYNYILSLQEKLTKPVSPTIKHIKASRRQPHRNVPHYRNDQQIKEETRSPSPQWQLLFSI